MWLQSYPQSRPELRFLQTDPEGRHFHCPCKTSSPAVEMIPYVCMDVVPANNKAHGPWLRQEIEDGTSGR